MKSAEEWNIPTISPDLVREIQLDAMKEGMQRAAKMNQDAIDFCGDSTCEICKNFSMRKEAILTAAEQLTEKDL